MTKSRVLIVDDNESMQKILSKFVELALGDPFAVGDGESALTEVLKSQAEGKGYLLVIMDIRMPNVDGIETTKRLREMGYQGLIAACTAAGSVSGKMKSVNAGVDVYLDKAVINQDIIAALIQQAKEKSQP